MFGSVPMCFRNKNAAKLAGKAYQMETGKSQVLLVKSNYYQPCETDDLEIAKKEGYEVVEYI
jgi:hypothetical protein